ncbi:MAG: hypothetical protein LC779_06270 [Actinobacteria bacterium]|nr:hypothetical protein [Actinomycetota bacterium]
MTCVVVPAAVPRPVLLGVAAAPHVPAAVVHISPRPVPTANPVAVQMARADAATVLRLQTELDRLRAQLAG